MCKKEGDQEDAFNLSVSLCITLDVVGFPEQEGGGDGELIFPFLGGGV